MSENSAEWLGTPGSIQDSLTELLRRGAQGLIEKAVEAELQGLLDRYENVIDLAGTPSGGPQRLLAQAGHPDGAGAGAGVDPQSPRSERKRGQVQRGAGAAVCTKPNGSRRHLPWLYLRGLSTGDMQEALAVLLDEEAKGLSPAVVGRLKAEWSEAYAAWNRRDLSGEH